MVAAVEDGAPVAAAVAAVLAGSLASVVKEAVRPVAFLHDGGVVSDLPSVKLTAAHCNHPNISLKVFEDEESWVRSIFSPGTNSHHAPPE